MALEQSRRILRDLARLSCGTLVLILVPFFVFGAEVDAWTFRALQTDASPGESALLTTVLLAVDTLAPIPSSIIATLSGTALGFARGTMAVWVGFNLASALGYGIGAGVFARWTRPKPPPDAQNGKTLSPATLGAVAATRGVPVLAEAVTLLAGAHRLPFLPFMSVSAVANLGVAAAYAYVGAMSANVNSFLLAFGGSVGLPAIALLIHRAATRKRRER